jgi:hypothetical protein
MTHQKIIACRQASDPLLEGHQCGYFCRVCGKELQVSPKGRQQIAKGGTPVCNACGEALGRRYGGFAQITYNPAALKQAGIKDVPLDKTLYGPSSLSIEVLPSGKLDSYITPEPGRPERPQWLVCDCCLRKSDRLWVWRHYGFCTAIRGFRRREYLEGGWSFCVYCEPLRGNRKALVARVVALNPQLDPLWLDSTYEVMLACLHGEVVAWQAGQRPPR